MEKNSLHLNANAWTIKNLIDILSKILKHALYNTFTEELHPEFITSAPESWLQNQRFKNSF